MTDAHEAHRQSIWRLFDAVFDPTTPRGCECIAAGEAGADADAFDATGTLICPDCWERMQEEGDSNDRRIDELVYELYGLTNEDIKIVERFNEGK